MMKEKMIFKITRPGNKSAVVCTQSLFIHVRLAMALIYSRFLFRRKGNKARALSFKEHIVLAPESRWSGHHTPWPRILPSELSSPDGLPRGQTSEATLACLLATVRLDGPQDSLDFER